MVTQATFFFSAYVFFQSSNHDIVTQKHLKSVDSERISFMVIQATVTFNVFIWFIFIKYFSNQKSMLATYNLHCASKFIL